MQITCPKCQAPMRQYERSGIVIDQCTDCRGIFLDHGELQHLMDKADEEASRSGQRSPQPQQAHGAHPQHTPPPPPPPATYPAQPHVPPPAAYPAAGQPGYGYPATPPPPPAYGQAYGYRHGYRHGGYRKRKSFLHNLFD